MSARSIRYRLSESNNIWPGFVDILATLLIVIIFVLMVFTVSQIYLSDALTGRDKALQDLRKQINELSKILIIESQDKQSALKSLQETETDLKKQELYDTLLRYKSIYKVSYCFSFYMIILLLYSFDDTLQILPIIALLYSTEYYKQLKVLGANCLNYNSCVKREVGQIPTLPPQR